MTFKKCIFLIIIVLYMVLTVTWFNRNSISYKIVGADPNWMDTASLTNHENDSVIYDKLEKASDLMKRLSTVFIYSSLFVVLVSVLFLRMGWFQPIIIVKIVLIVVGLFAFILILANGISFIPGPSIR